MKKKIISAVLVFMMVLGIPSLAFADGADEVNDEELTEHQDNASAEAAQADDEQTIYLKGEGNNNSSFSNWLNVFYVGGSEDIDPGNVSTWHLVYSSNNFGAIISMQLTFTNGEVFYWAPSDGPSLNPGGNNPGWIIVAPAGWEIAYVQGGNNANVSGSFLVTSEGGNPQFNISGYSKGVPLPQTGALDFSGPFYEDYTLITLQKAYQLTFQPYRQKFMQVLFRPTFKRETSSVSGTLVTRLEYDNNTAAAKPINGGTFKNGHTYVEVNVCDAKGENGVDYQIADSSFNANGKKTPAEYNRPIEYYYNVKIDDGKITVSFDDNLISANVGAYAVASLDVASSGNNGNGNNGNNGNGNGNNGNGNGNNGNGNAKGNSSSTTTVQDPDKAFPGNAPSHKKNSVTIDMPANAGKTIYLYVHIDGISWYSSDYKFVGWEEYKVMQLADLFVKTEFVSCKELDEIKICEQTLTRELVGDFKVTVLNSSGDIVYYGDPALVEDLEPGTYTYIVDFDNEGVSYKDLIIGEADVVANDSIPVSFAPVKRNIDPEYTYLPWDYYAEPIFLAPIYLDPYNFPPLYLGSTTDPFGYYAQRIN